MALLRGCRRAALRIGPVLAVKVSRQREEITLGLLLESRVRELEKIPSFMGKPEFLYDFVAGPVFLLSPKVPVPYRIHTHLKP